MSGERKKMCNKVGEPTIFVEKYFNHQWVWKTPYQQHWILRNIKKKIISEKELIARICRARVKAVNCLLATLLWRKIEWQYFSATKFKRWKRHHHQSCNKPNWFQIYLQNSRLMLRCKDKIWVLTWASSGCGMFFATPCKITCNPPQRTNLPYCTVLSVGSASG